MGYHVKLCERCSRPVADESDLANDRMGVCYDAILQKHLEKLEMTNDNDLSCRETVLTKALQEACDTLTALLVGRSDTDLERGRSALVRGRAVLQERQ